MQPVISHKLGISEVVYRHVPLYIYVCIYSFFPVSLTVRGVLIWQYIGDNLLVRHSN